MEYSELKKKGRALLAEGKVQECLLMFESALKLTPDDERIRQKVDVLREAAKEEDENNDDDRDSVKDEPIDENMVEVCPGYYLHSKIHSKLFPYQRQSLKWMFKLFQRRKGGVLGDDMGLGKTIQVIAYLAGLFDMQKINSVLLIMPVSLIGNWMTEFEKWAPGMTVVDYHSGTKREKEIGLRKVMNRGGVILTTYGMVTTRSQDLCSNSGRKFIWDYVILDEGHRIKNPNKTQAAVFGLLAHHRLVLTGTAVQNNLSELWSLYHFTHQGTLFGNLAGFKQDFETPINRGRERDAKAGEREMGVQLARQLKEMIAPYFLRRTKAEVFRNGDGPKIEANKEDLVLWTFLSSTQQELYRDFLQSDAVKEILLTSKSPLVQLNILKKICDHPRLLPKKACVQLGLCDEMSEAEIQEFLEDDKHCPFSIDDVSDEDLLSESGKMRLMLELTEQLRQTGHRTLIFSTSRRILDMIQRILRSRNFTIARLDGTVTKNIERKRIVEDFQNRGSDVFLLTTQVGGVGLTLTNADRVIIYDPNWNPATDAQAVDRAFRIGQKNDVFVYRLITCGTVEEKIYARQIFKDSIIKQTTGNQSDPTRYFTRSQLRELFVLADTTVSETQKQLQEMHTKTVSEFTNEHIAFLLGTELVYGVSHHDLMFSTEEEKEDVSEQQLEFISHQVQRARTLREKDAEIIQEDLRQNPHLVPNINHKGANQRNMAARMGSTVNPWNLHDRPPPRSSEYNYHFENADDSDEDSNDESKGKPDFVEINSDDDDDDDIVVVSHVDKDGTVLLENNELKEENGRSSAKTKNDSYRAKKEPNTDDDDDDSSIEIIPKKHDSSNSFEEISEQNTPPSTRKSSTRHFEVIDDDDDDDISDVKVNQVKGSGDFDQKSEQSSPEFTIKRRAVENKIVDLTSIEDVDDDDDEFVGVVKSRPFDESGQQSSPEFVIRKKQGKRNRIINSDDDDDNDDDSARKLTSVPGYSSSKMDDSTIGSAKKRRSSVAVTKRSPSPDLDLSDESRQSLEPEEKERIADEERKREIEEEVYDQAFDTSDEIDQSVIEKSILESTFRSQDPQSFVVDDSVVEDSVGAINSSDQENSKTNVLQDLDVSEIADSDED